MTLKEKRLIKIKAFLDEVNSRTTKFVENPDDNVMMVHLETHLKHLVDKFSDCEQFKADHNKHSNTMISQK